jgi:hypothetical protein
VRLDVADGRSRRGERAAYAELWMGLPSGVVDLHHHLGVQCRLAFDSGIWCNLFWCFL